MGLQIPQCTLDQYENEIGERRLLHGVLDYWARQKPDAAAIIHHDRGMTDSWASLDRASSNLAMELLRRGFSKGDFLATSLPFSREHILLEYACFKIGAIHVPLDLRLSPEEVLRSLSLVRAAGYAFPGETRAADFRELGRAVQRHCPFVRELIQLSPPESVIEGAEAFPEVMRRADQASSALRDVFAAAAAAVTEKDGAQVIFTTGSTGAPKPALLTHRSITVQNMCLGAAFFGEDKRVLVNLPPSHVGGQAELLMTTLFRGGTAVVLEIFDAARSLGRDRGAWRQPGGADSGDVPARVAAVGLLVARPDQPLFGRLRRPAGVTRLPGADGRDGADHRDWPRDSPRRPGFVLTRR